MKLKLLKVKKRREKALKSPSTASNKERLLLLYLLKSKQVLSRQDLAKLIGRDKATITRWIRKYKDKGLTGLLEIKQAPGKIPLVRGANLQRLKQRLQITPEQIISLTSYDFILEALFSASS